MDLRSDGFAVKRTGAEVKRIALETSEGR